MPKIITPEEAAAELLKRREAIANLAPYIEYVSDKPTARHMRFLCDKLKDAADRKVMRLLICEPPGHAKSWVCSHHFPAFYLSKFPEHSLIFATHTDSFAETWGRKVRNLMLSPEHQRLFPGVNVSDDSRAAGRWDLSSGGSYYAVGVGSSVTGRRADLVIIDDPLRGIEDANSQTVRDKLWDWYGADLYTRLKPGGVIILIQTRWHLDDLAGRLLVAAENPKGEKWEKVILPAIAGQNDILGRKPGEALWPEWADVSALNRMKDQPSMTNRIWSSLYMQSPVVDGGNLIKRSWIQIWNRMSPPKLKYVIQSWDTAVSRNETSAFSVCLTYGVFQEEKPSLEGARSEGLMSMILLSRFRMKLEYPELRKMAMRLAVDYLDTNYEMPMKSQTKRVPDIILIEDAPVGKPLISDLQRAGVAVTRFNPAKHGSKDARLMVASEIMENGRYYVPGQAPHFTQPRKWADDHVDSLVSFPASASRDEADAASQAIIRIKLSGWVKNSADAQDPGYSEPERVSAFY